MHFWAEEMHAKAKTYPARFPPPPRSAIERTRDTQCEVQRVHATEIEIVSSNPIGFQLKYYCLLWHDPNKGPR